MRIVLFTASLCLMLAACSPPPIATPPVEEVRVSGTVTGAEARFDALRLLALPGEAPLADVEVRFSNEGALGGNADTDAKGAYSVEVYPFHTYSVTASRLGETDWVLAERSAPAYVRVSSQDVARDFGVADFLVGSMLQEINPDLFHPKSNEFLANQEGFVSMDALDAAVAQMRKELEGVTPLPTVAKLDEARRDFKRLASNELKAKVYRLVGKTYEASGAVEVSDTTETERETPYFTYRLPSQWQAAKLPDQRIVNSWETFDGVNRIADGRAIASMRVEQTTSDVTLEVIKEAWIKNAGSDPIEVEKTTVAGKEAYFVTRTTTDAGVTMVIRKYMVAHLSRVFAFGMILVKDDPKTDSVVSEFEAIIKSLSWKAEEA